MESHPARPDPARRLTLLLWVLLVAGLTLTPQPALDATEEVSRLCVICGGRGTADAVLNVVLFLPLGWLLGPRGVAAATLTGVLGSASIELAQVLLPGRYPTVGDVVWNGLGAGLGALLHVRRDAWLVQPPARLGLLVSGAVAVGFPLAGALLAPSWTRDHYWGQWTADLGSMPQYGGRLLSASLDELRVPPGRFPDDVDPRGHLEGDFTLGGRVVKGPPPPAVSPIVSIYDGRQIEVVLLGADGEDLVWRERTRSVLVRLDQPDLRLEGALAGASVGDTLDIAVRRHGAERCLEAGGRAACGLGFTPGRTWSLLLWPEGMGEAGRRRLDFVWLLGLFAAVGGLARGWWRWTAGAAVVVAGVLGGVGFTRLVMPPAAEWTAMAVGLTLGGLVAPAAARLRRPGGPGRPPAADPGRSPAPR